MLGLSDRGLEISKQFFFSYFVSFPNNPHPPDYTTKSVSLQGPEPVDQQLVVAVTEVGHRLEDVGEHGVGRLGWEYRVE